jgi:hypothetical protein
MKRIVRLTERDLSRIVKRVINEQGQTSMDSPLSAKLISPSGMASANLKFVKSKTGFEAVNLNICEFFQIKRTDKLFKTKLELTNISKKGLYIMEANVRSIDLDLYPQVTNKLLAPGQRITFNVEITPASLDDDSVAFDVSYKAMGSNEPRSILLFEIENNIDECAVE